MEYLLSSVVGFVLGSFPTAYILVKKVSGIDIRNEGSGNVGAYNSLQVSKSKFIGISVLVIDFLKGVLSGLVPLLIFPNEFIFPALSLTFAVFSHCFNPWLKFKGGRGLATAAGGAVLVFPFLLVVWCILWVIFYLMKRDIIFANILSTIFSLLLVYGTTNIAIKYTYPRPLDISTLIMVSTAVLLIIFIKHIEPLNELISKTKKMEK